MVGLVAIVTLLLLAPLPFYPSLQRWPAMFDEIENLGHPLAFALLAHVGFKLLRVRKPAPARTPYLIVILAAAAFGLATEAMQEFVGRDSSWIDLGNDVLGACFALLLHARRECLSPRLASVAAVAVTLAATGPFLWTAAAYGLRAARAPVLWCPDAVLFQRFSQWYQGEYPGLVIKEPMADWSGHDALILELHNLHDAALPVTLRVHDRLHNLKHEDRYTTTVELPAGSSRTLRIPLEDIRLAPRTRQMDMTAIRGIIIFQSAANQPPHFRVDEIRLER
jgi:VanZ family protein